MPVSVMTLPTILVAWVYTLIMTLVGTMSMIMTMTILLTMNDGVYIKTRVAVMIFIT